MKLFSKIRNRFYIFENNLKELKQPVALQLVQETRT